MKYIISIHIIRGECGFGVMDGNKVAIERVESLFDEDEVKSAVKLVKTIGVINLFGNAGVHFSKADLSLYAKHALDIESPEMLIDLLNRQ